MSHQALYRKFRSKTFDEILGQEHVTKTLKNQILSNNVAHAYLFCGIRGTGKTSTARILSRAVNCLNNTDGNPCNECEICKSILDETNMDVVEMDAASNNSVDDIRDLRDKVNFLPSKSRYKVYIIDEVHMLSKGAFNALLKILEEPPEHLIFILATTEPQKIPATILSRCQRFDLRRINVDTMVKSMTHICEKLGVEAEEKALKLIAANSDGAMRDAQSILDRCLTFNSEKIKYDDVNELLGIVSFDNIAKIAGYIIEKNINECMIMVNENLNQGKDLLLFIEEIITYFRNLLIYKNTGLNDNLVRMTDEGFEMLKSHSDKITTDTLINLIMILSDTLLECKRAVNPRIIFETRIISLTSRNEEISDFSSSKELIDSLIERIEKLEATVQNLANMPVHNSIQNNDSNAYVKSNKISQERKKVNTTTNPKNENSDISSNDDNDKSNDIDIDDNIDDDVVYNMLNSNWNGFVKAVRRESAPLSAIIRESKVTEVKDKIITFEYDSKFSFHYKAANQDKNKQSLKKILLGFLKANFDVNFILKADKIQHNEKSMNDVFEEMKEAFGEDKVELK